MPDRDIHRVDLWNVRDELQKATQAGFERIETALSGVNERLDAINGRVRNNEVASAQHNIQIKNLERELFGPEHHKEDEKPAEDEKSITRRDVSVALAAGGGVWAFLNWLLPFFRQGKP